MVSDGGVSVSILFPLEAYEQVTEASENVGQVMEYLFLWENLVKGRVTNGEGVRSCEKKDIPLRKIPYAHCVWEERAGGEEYQFKSR